MLALITGGTGFVGRHLAKCLNKADTRSVSLTANPAELTSDVQESRLIDIRDSAALTTLAQDLKPQQIYHLAAITSLSAAASDERAAFDVNIWGTRNVLDSASRLSPPPRVLNVSTSQVYGDTATSPITEDAPLNPRNTYASTKAAAEMLARQYSSKCKVITVRPFNHSGPGQSAHFVLSFFAHEIAAIELGQRDPVLRTGNLNVRRDFTDVRDVVRAYTLLLDKGTPGESYNVCSGNGYLISDALDFLLSLSSSKIKVEQDPAKTRHGEASTTYGSYEKLARDIGWQPTISFQQMLTDTLQYWRQTLSAKATAQATH